MLFSQIMPGPLASPSSPSQPASHTQPRRRRRPHEKRLSRVSKQPLYPPRVLPKAVVMRAVQEKAARGVKRVTRDTLDDFHRAAKRPRV